MTELTAEHVLSLAERWSREGELPAVGLVVVRGARTTGVCMFGRQRLGDEPGSIRDDAIFLVASITKPVVATGSLLLVERGQLRLGDRVTRYLPEFGRQGKNGVTIRHLLTHTSGLPDMLPDNVALREANAPLSEFVRRTCEIKLDFPPGRGVQYQSMGFAVLGEVISRVAGVDCAEFLRSELFEPLGMADTRLGSPEEWYEGQAPVVDRIAEIQLPDDQEAVSWNWNGRYWRMLGAPWGGLLTTPSDLARFGRMLLGRGRLDDVGVLSPASVAAATRNQLAAMPDVPEIERRCRPWGLGWRLNWPAHSANFGDLLGPATFGHWGATGTLMWIDPGSDTVCVILSTRPQEPHGSFLAALSNGVAAALVPSPGS